MSYGKPIAIALHGLVVASGRRLEGPWPLEPGWRSNRVGAAW